MRRVLTLSLIRTKNTFILNQIKSIELLVLMRNTEKAFQIPKSNRFRYIMKDFAAYTKEIAPYGNPKRVYDVSYQLGKRVRKLSGLSNPKELEELVFFLYKNIEIEMRGSLEDEIWISPCYFSRYYSPKVCAMMSNMDSGIVTGIYGGRQLKFRQRITEGCPCCKAFLERNI